MTLSKQQIEARTKAAAQITEYIEELTKLRDLVAAGETDQQVTEAVAGAYILSQEQLNDISVTLEELPEE